MHEREDATPKTRAAATRIAFVAACLAMGSSPAHADGFAELRAALAQPVGNASIKGSWKVESTSSQGDDKETERDRGEAVAGFEDGPAGLRVTYPRDLLTRADREALAKEKDTKARTPALSGMRTADPSSLRAMLSPATALLTLLDDCTPSGEAVEAWEGRPARRLTCEYGLSKPKGRDRKYIKTYEGKVDAWIAADGMPLAVNVDTKLTGRAYVVISFETSNHVEQRFATAGDRLVMVREEKRTSGSGAGEKGEGRTVREIALTP